ncbi:MAG TPA: hypothetical protein VF062_06475 [Candidatus Limnocylindrales bacterium]
MKAWPRRKHCVIPGHGMACALVYERGPGQARYPRTTEKRLALRYEELAG